MNNQRGFATLELILIILIIASLSTVALPKAARMVDAVRLDYEMKNFLSTLDFAKSLNKNSSFLPEIFNKVNFGEKPNPLQINLNVTEYRIKRNDLTIQEPHKLPEGFFITSNKSLTNQINFSSSNDGHVTLTSRMGNNRYIIFNTVGRWRGDITAPK